MTGGYAIDGTCAARFAGVRGAFERNFAEGDLGAGCAVTLEGELVADLWGGHRDPARRTPWERDTLVNLWSTTKMASALCVLMLHDRGELSVDAPLAEYWPGFGAHGKEAVLVRHVLGHTAGLPVFDEPVDDLDVFDWSKCCGRLAAQRPRWRPGHELAYHAETWSWLVGELVRRVDGRSLGVFFRDEVARPLGLDLHIGLDDREFGRVADVATLHAEPSASPDAELRALGQAASARSAALVNTAAWRRAELPASNAHGNARAVALAMAPLANAGRLGGRQLLSPATIERALEVQAEGLDQTTGRNFKMGMGYGLHSQHTPMGTVDRTLWWAGWGGSMCVVDAAKRMTVAYVMNRMRGEGDLRAVGVIFAAHAALAG